MFSTGCFRQVFFIWDKRRGSLRVLDRWSSYTVTTVEGFFGADSALAVIGECFSFRGGRSNKKKLNFNDAWNS